MSYFHDYEKVKTLRKSLLIGSIWEIIEQTWYNGALNIVGKKVCIYRFTPNGIQYSYVYDDDDQSFVCYNQCFYRDKETFSRTFKPLAVDIDTYRSNLHD